MDVFSTRERLVGLIYKSQFGCHSLKESSAKEEGVNFLSSGKGRDVHTSNANASRMRYARAFQYFKMATILFPESALP